MKLPKSVFNYIVAFILFLLAGILFANGILVLISIVPFLLLMTGFILKIPKHVELKRSVSSEQIYTDEILTITITVSVKLGIGVITLCDILPDGFQLVSGNNLMIFVKGPEDKFVSKSYAIKCNNAGEYKLNSIRCESKHILYAYAIQGLVQKEQSIKVIPRIFAPGRIKGISGASRIPLPLHAVSQIGIPTLDFKEVRLYTYGDSFKYINWKASSRNRYRGFFWPVINEYDKEGKKVVWIFLDGSWNMDYGTNIKNIFGYASEAVCQLASFYIKQQCSTAFCTYNTENVCIYPGSGKKQYHKILNEVLKLNTEKAGKRNTNRTAGWNLEKTLVAHRSHITGSKPLFIIITRYTKAGHNQLKSSIKEMAKYAPSATSHLQIMVINIIDYSLSAETASEKAAAELLALQDKNLTADLKKRCRWVDWNPAKSNLFDALLKQVI